jgi:hypothetical protein
LAVARTSRRWRQHRADRLAVADHDAVHAAHLAGLGRDPESAGCADERHRGLAPGARDLERRRTARVGEAPPREERAAPDRGDVVARSGRQLVRQTADRPAAGVEQPGLARERLSTVEHAHEVLVGASEP